MASGCCQGSIKCATTTHCTQPYSYNLQVFYSILCKSTLMSPRTASTLASGPDTNLVSELSSLLDSVYIRSASLLGKNSENMARGRWNRSHNAIRNPDLEDASAIRWMCCKTRWSPTCLCRGGVPMQLLLLEDLHVGITVSFRGTVHEAC